MTPHRTAAANRTRHLATAPQCHHTAPQATAPVQDQAAHTDHHRVAHTVAQAEAPHRTAAQAAAPATALARVRAPALVTVAAQDLAHQVARTVVRPAAAVARVVTKWMELLSDSCHSDC